MQLSPGDFATLGRLDLSYNTLSGVAVIDLGILPVLKELHLTGEQHLPIECVTFFPLNVYIQA